jgi:beta-lactamase class A
MKRIFASFVILILFTSLLFFFYFKLTSYNKRLKSFGKLKIEIEKLSSSFKDNLSFLIKDLNFPNLILSSKKDEKFPAASLIKLPILAVAFKAVEEGKISLEKEITICQKDIVGGSGVIKKMNLPVKLSIKKILELMITNSDNTATNILIDLLGFDYINDSFRKFGLKNTILRRKMMDFRKRRRGIENYTTASDIAFLLEKIYKGKLIDERFSKMALYFLKNQKINDRIPRYLPKELEVAHKTGLEKGVVHDAGIVFTPHGDYIICLLTSGVKDYKKTKEFVARFSLLTYNFLYREG